MFAQLPEILKQEIIKHLRNNNFPAAKKLHDDWIRDHPQEHSSLHANDSNNSSNDN